jgi:hypothetical protein
MTRRVVLGKYANGDMGLKVSLPGFDALLDDDSDPTKFSFNSSWSADIMRVHMVGKVRMGVKVPHTLGFVPHMEASYRDTADQSITRAATTIDYSFGSTLAWARQTFAVTSDWIMFVADSLAPPAGPTEFAASLDFFQTYSPLFGVQRWANYLIWDKQAW